MGIGIGLGLGLSFAGKSGPSSFVFEEESTAIIEAMTAAGATPSTGHQIWINRTVKRLKNANVWNKFTGLYLRAGTEAQWLINWKSPGTFNLTKVGTPTFAAWDGVTTAANTSYYDTGIPLNSFSNNNAHISVHSLTATGANNNDAGAQDGSSNGLTINCNSAAGTYGGRCMSASANVDLTNTLSRGDGWHCLSALSNTMLNGFRDGLNIANPTKTNPAITASTTLRILMAAGSATFSGRKLSSASFGQGFTNAEWEAAHAALLTFVYAAGSGFPIINEAGYLPAEVNADVIVYGTTEGGVSAAYAAARAGLSVALVGGWRDHPGNLGGMPASGLGFTDWQNLNSIGGLPRDVIQYCRDADNGGNMTAFDVDPNRFQMKMRQLLDPDRGGQEVPIYYTASQNGSPGGIASVQKTGTRITGFSTVDGRTFIGTYFIDASYEFDLGVAAGITYIEGREAAGSDSEAANGYRGVLSTFRGNNNQFTTDGTDVGTLLVVDPYVTPGNSGSGLLPGVIPNPGVANGVADGLTQSFNFRLTVAASNTTKVPISSTPPTGYSAADYEVLFRYFAALTGAGVTITTSILSSIQNSGPAAYKDMNNRGGFSTDLLGSGTSYAVDHTGAGREVIWKAIENNMRRFIYACAWSSDPRVTSNIKGTAQTNWSLSAVHYLDPHPNDSLYWPPQLYVREDHRLVGDFILNANDLTATDGTTPRSTKTIATISYTMDSHHMDRIEDTSGTPRCWLAGGFQVAAGGVDQTVPFPIEAALPMATNCTNLVSVFGVSATHVAFGACRVVLTAMQVGESMAVAVAQAIANGDQDLQSIDYPTLRTTLLALPDGTPPVLPQLS